VCGPGRSARRTNTRRCIAGNSQNPAPLTLRQLCALLAGASRELAWGLPAVSREVKAWRALAERIPAPAIRQDAIDALSRKRGQTDGAALFTILPRERNLPLLRFLVAYQLTWDYLDSVHERCPTECNGRQLHLALIDALRPGAPRADYYRHHPWRDDGGYLDTLVEVCRSSCRTLPGFTSVQYLALREARRAQVLALNHEPDAGLRDAALRQWAEDEFPRGAQGAHWFELSGACSAGLTIFALLALAAEPSCCTEEIERTYATYLPWTSVAATMLDSYVDRLEDTESGDHIYVSHYPSREAAITRIAWLIRRCLTEASRLDGGERHILIAASMTALYLSKDSARAPVMRDETKALADSAGSLTRLLLPILRLWRTAYAVRST
jgi:tetraprenyl-beta-curcumene synthase